MSKNKIYMIRYSAKDWNEKTCSSGELYPKT